MMHYGQIFRNAGLGVFSCALIVFGCAQQSFAQSHRTKAAAQAQSTQAEGAQTQNVQTPSVRPGDHDPFRRFRAPAHVKRANSAPVPLAVPPIQERIDRYKAQKLAAMNAQLPAPKPTTALLLSEVQVNGIFRTPRGYAAMVEATPIHLSYVIYPGESFFDGQLVAIEEDRLVFRHEMRWTDGRRDRSVVTVPLRQPNAVTDSMTSQRSSDNSGVGSGASADNASSSQHASAAANGSQDQQAIEEAIRQNKVVVGMTKQQAIRSWGAPDDIVYATTEHGRREQWVYKNKGNIVFDNGILESFQAQ